MADAQVDPPTLRTLLRRTALGLRLETAEGELEPGALDRPVQWVHSSDLVDPAPFLVDGVTLLTTGTQFLGDDPEAFAAYVQRLKDRGVIGLGFGTEVVRDGIPEALAAACRTVRMPLFEVPFRTPFIAVAQANAESVAAAAYARRTWALQAQRSVSLAALRPDGLDATLAELSRVLGAWVGLFDSAGALTRRHPRSLAASTARALEADVATALRRGTRAGSSLRIDETPFTLMTLGRGGHLHGVLAIGAGDLDQEARGVVTAVVALAELSLTQDARFADAVGRLRGALLRSMLDGDPSLAGTIARELWGPRHGAMPPEPVEVIVTDAPDDRLIRHLEQESHAVFFAVLDDSLTIVAAAGDDVGEALAEHFGIALGVSLPASYRGLARARAQAQAALAQGGAGATGFGDVASAGVVAAIDSSAAVLRAEALLAPLRATDAEQGTQLESALRAWLRHDARFDVAADALGVHRHTVRARVAHAARVLGVDLGSFPARADLWVALTLAETAQTE